MVGEMLILGLKSEHGNMNGSVDRPPLHHRRVALLGRLMQKPESSHPNSQYWTAMTAVVDAYC